MTSARAGAPRDELLTRREFERRLWALLAAGTGLGTFGAAGSARACLPEYRRTFREVFFVYDQVRVPCCFDEILDIVRALPPRRRLIALASKARAAEARRRLEGSALDVEILEFDGDLSGDWARDVFFAGRRRGRSTLFLPYSKSARTPSRLTRGFEVFKKLAGDGRDLVQVPLAFEGGNLASDKIAGECVLFAGNSVLVESDRLYRSVFGRPLPAAECMDVLRKFFGADRVVPLGRTGASGEPLAQSRLLFHIDLACALLGEGLCAVQRFDPPRRTEDVAEAIRAEEEAIARVLGAKSSDGRGAAEDIEKRALEERQELEAAALELEAIRKTFRALGYRTADLVTDWRHVRRMQSYANVLVCGRRLLMPIFPREGAGIGRVRSTKHGRPAVEILRPPRPEEYAMNGANLANYRLYCAYFPDVRPVRDVFHLAGGNLHCVLASFD